MVCEDEQSFYDRHFDKLQKNNESSSYSRNGTGAADSHNRPGVVGPMAMSSSIIQNMMRNDNNTIDHKLERSTRKKVTKILSKFKTRTNVQYKDPNLEKLLLKGINNSPKSSSLPLTPNTNLGITTHQNSPTVASPTSSVNPNNAPSHEVIANFFQSLLKNSSGGPGSPTTLNSPSSGAMLSAGATNNRSSSKDLEMMRQYTSTISK